MGEAYLFVDSEFQVREINAEALRLARRPAAEIIGRNFWELAYSGHERRPLWDRAMAERTPLASEYFYTWRDGRQAWIATRAHPSRGGLAILYRDISARKETEAELERVRAELKLASRAGTVGTITAMLAQQLVQPLTVAGNYVAAASRLLRPLPAAEAKQARDALGLAASAVQRAGEILARLRSFVAKRQADFDAQDLQAIVAEASIVMLSQAQQSGVRIDFVLDPQANWVKADPVQIRQVLISLIENAVEAMADSTERRVTVTSAVAGDWVEIAVADTGPGLGEAGGEALFEPFFSNKKDGVGVGLSISRAIVEAHGGTIEAETRLEGGARFRFTLPRSHERK